jgi:hypothetical protein
MPGGGIDVVWVDEWLILRRWIEEKLIEEIDWGDEVVDKTVEVWIDGVVDKTVGIWNLEWRGCR